VSAEMIEVEKMLEVVSAALTIGFSAGRSNKGILLDVDPKRSTVAFEFADFEDFMNMKQDEVKFRQWLEEQGL